MTTRRSDSTRVVASRVCRRDPSRASIQPISIFVPARSIVSRLVPPRVCSERGM